MPVAVTPDALDHSSFACQSVDMSAVAVRESGASSGMVFSVAPITVRRVSGPPLQRTKA